MAGRGRPFEIGNKANPTGRVPLAPHLRKFKAKTYDEFIESLEKMGSLTQEDLIEMISVEHAKTLPKCKRPKNIPIIFARFILECQRGNMVAMKMFFEYMFGKPKEFDPNSLDVTANVRPLANATSEQLKSIMEANVINLSGEK